MRRGEQQEGSERPRIGIALAGGALEGAIYQIGALRAVDEAIEGLEIGDLDVYVGVSSGAFLCACLANHLTTDQMCRAIIKPEPGEHPFVPETFLTPAFRELGRRGREVPRLLGEALRDYLKHRDETRLSSALTHLARALPVGVFDNEPIRRYLKKIYSMKGRSDDFRELDKKLVVVAADLDSGQAVRFGDEGYDHVPISRAVQASTALPGLYSPVEIDGRFYLDGILLKTLHASVALDAGVDLLLSINPIVPVDTVRAVEQGVMKRGKLVDRGLVSVLSQTVRTMLYSRLEAGLAAYGDRFDADVVLLEPARDDYRMFFTNIFSFSDRKDVCEHAYIATLAQLRKRADELEPVLARHGLSLNRAVIEDDEPDLWSRVGLEPPAVKTADTLERLDSALDRVEALL